LINYFILVDGGDGNQCCFGVVPDQTCIPRCCILTL